MMQAKKGLTMVSVLGLLVGLLVAAPVQAQPSATAELIIDEQALIAAIGYGGDDIAPNGFGRLSTGSYVYFNDSSNAGYAMMDCLILFATGGGTATATMVASATDIAAAMSIPLQAPPTHTVQSRGLEIDSNDNVFLLLADYTETIVSGQRSTAVIRVPNTGGDTFGTPQLVIDANRIGQVDDGAAYRLAIDTSTTPDTLVLAVNNEVVEDGSTTNGIFTLPSTASNDADPTLIGLMNEVVLALGGTPGVDRASPSDLTVLSGGDIALCNGRTDPKRGALVRMDRSSGACTLLVDTLVSSATGQAACLSYNDTNGYLGVFWNRWTNQDGGPTDDRLEEWDVDTGTLVDTLTVRKELVVLNPDNTADSSFQLGDASYNFINTGSDYYVFSSHGTTGSEESVYRITASPPPGPTPTPTNTPIVAGVSLRWSDYR